MKKVLLLSILLLLGLAGSQALPGLVGESYSQFSTLIRVLTMIGLSFIMIHVGFEFDLDKKNLRKYGWDYAVAATAATFPWLFCCAYFIFVLLPENAWSSGSAWTESLLASRFAAPTSAGVLFTMLAAAGLGATWLFKKARVLAIFDDLDTVLLMIPLKIAIVGFKWELAALIPLMALMVWLAWKYLHAWTIPTTWPWVLAYAAGITFASEAIYFATSASPSLAPVHIEVLLPAFVLGCVMARPEETQEDTHALGPAAGLARGPGSRSELRASSIVSAAFMVLVGLSMPVVQGIFTPTPAPTPGASTTPGADTGALQSLAPDLSAGDLVLHVLAVTLLANLGKMFPAFCYRREATLRERLALAVGLWPRGEVGAGVLVVSLSYGIGGPVLAVAMLSLTLNLVLTGVFILIIQALLQPEGAGRWRRVSSPRARLAQEVNP